MGCPGRNYDCFGGTNITLRPLTAIIPHSKTSTRHMKNGVLRITLDIQNSDIMETSRLLSLIGTPLTITLERKKLPYAQD